MLVVRTGVPMSSFRWDTDFKARVLAWLKADTTRGPADADREFTPEALERWGKPLSRQTIRKWMKDSRPGGPSPSRTAKGQREKKRRKQAARARGELHVLPPPPDEPAPSAAVAVDGLDPDLFSDDPIERQQALIRTLGKSIVDARRLGQGGVVSKLLDQLAAANKELDVLKEAARDRSGDYDRMPEGEFLLVLAELAAEQPDAYLEVYVREYMRRHRLKLAR